MSDPLGAFLQGLVGDEETPGFRGGYGFRTGIADRKRKLATEQETLTYERAKRLREDVGFQLQQRYIQSQIDRNERTPIPRNIDPNSPEAQEADYRDWQRRYDYERQHPKPTKSRATARQDLGSVERQVDDTRADLGRAEREAPTKPMFFLTPSDSTQYAADSASSAERVGGLRQRADSLSTVRDSIAADVQGRRFQRPGAAGKKTPADRWEELVNQGVPAAEATRRVKQEFRLP